MPTKFPIITLPVMRGINLRDDINRLGPGQGTIRENVVVNPDGAVQKSPGFANMLTSALSTSPMLSLTEFLRWDGSRDIVNSCGTSLYKLNTDNVTETAIATSLTEAPMRFVSYGDHLYGGNGFDENKMIDNNLTVGKWQITAPDSALTSGAGPAGNVNGTYYYYYTFYDSVNGIESPPSPVSTVLTVSSKQVSLSNIDTSANTLVTQRRVYRTLTGGTVYYLLTTIADNTTTTYTDNLPDTTIGAATNVSDVDGTSVLPNCNIFALFENRVFCAGDYLQPQRVYYTEANELGKYIPLTNYQDFAITVTAMVAIDNGLLVFESNKTWLWTSAPTGKPRLLSSTYGT